MENSIMAQQRLKVLQHVGYFPSDNQLRDNVALMCGLAPKIHAIFL